MLCVSEHFPDSPHTQCLLTSSPHSRTLPRPGRHRPVAASLCAAAAAAAGEAWRRLGAFLLHLRPLLLPLTQVWGDSTSPNMGFVGLGSAVLLAALVGVCSAGSDAPRGVAVGFVFDPKAKCEPPCEHAGICIRNNTCFCSRGYEGETCQYGDDTNL